MVKLIGRKYTRITTIILKGVYKVANKKRKKGRKSRGRYSKMKRVVKKAMRREEDLPRIGFKELMKEWAGKAKILVQSQIFKRTVVIMSSFLLMGVGVAEVHRSRTAKAYDQAMSVSPSNEPTPFALSGVNIEFRPQFRSGDTYLIPFEIDNIEALSMSPEDYILQVQGVNEELDPTMTTRLMLFGTSGRGVIMTEGNYTGEPMNIYLISTNSLAGSTGERVVVTSEEISDMQAEKGNLIINEEADGTTEEEQDEGVPTGTITVGGQQMTVGVDMVATRTNPAADNVTPTYRDVNVNSTPAEIYDVTFGAVDRSVILTNIANTEEARDGVVETMEEYNYRLEDDPTLSPEDVELIREANAIASESLGQPEDNEKIEELLSQTSQYEEDDVQEATDDNKPLDEMTEEERTEYFEQEIDQEDLGISNDTSTVDALDRLRQTLVDLNYELALYDVELSYIDEVSSSQDDVGRSAVRYEVLTAFE